MRKLVSGGDIELLPACIQDDLRSIRARREAGASVWEWFDHRVRSSREARLPIPWRRLDPVQSQSAFQSAMAATTGDRDRMAYVHIPFCHQRCTFCGYARMLLDRHETGEMYAAALMRQINHLKATSWVQARPFQAVYFGGGTPTALGVDVLAELVAAFGAALPLVGNAEITVETSITDIDADGLARLRAAGVNRVSFGIQTFDTRLRRSLGRSADQEEVIQRLEQAGRIGFEGVCADLIYGLPGQTTEAFQCDIDMLMDALPINGLSLYPLVLFPGSVLAAADYVYPVQATRQEYQMFISADEALEAKGWRCFTPVQYGVGQHENAVYVSAYGRGSDVLAFGAGGRGRIGALAYWHAHDSDAFVDDWAGPHSAPVTCLLAPSAYVQYHPWYQLIESLRFAQQARRDRPTAMDELVEALVSFNLVGMEEGDWVLTQSGRFWAGNIGEMMSLVIREQEAGR